MRRGRLAQRWLASDAWTADRAAVWRVHIGEDADLQRTMLESGTIALVAAGEAAISDEEWGAFASDVRTGQPRSSSRSSRSGSASGSSPARCASARVSRIDGCGVLVRVEWLRDAAPKRIDEDLRRQLDAPGTISAVRVSLGALRLERLLQS